jgi:hypothetical protein
VLLALSKDYSPSQTISEFSGKNQAELVIKFWIASTDKQLAILSLMRALKLSPQYTTFIHKQALFTHKLLFWRVLTNKSKGQIGGGKIYVFDQNRLFLS